jgi:acetyl esterase/lipase
MNRRLALKSGLAAAVAIPCRSFASDQLEVIPLWPGEAPGGGGPTWPRNVDDRGGVNNVAKPILEVFRPARPNGSAILVAGGGGYRRIGNGHEAYPAAEWIVAQGITAFVLTYRLPGEGWTVGPEAPLQDAQRAIRLIRSDQTVARDRVSVLGFSAGGHLMGMAAAWHDHHTYEPVDAVDRLPNLPDAVALIYPVITIEPPYDHTNTRRQLVGPYPTPSMSAAWSVQTHVRRGMPPTFMIQCEDDTVAVPENTLIMAAACQDAGTQVDMQRYLNGGHGFGMGEPDRLPSKWPMAYVEWLRAKGLLK